MKRQVNLEDISDGKRYGREDMVRADCLGCEGCSACCREGARSQKETSCLKENLC